MQGVQPKVKLVIINKKTNDVLKEFFSNNVSLVTAKVSDSLYNDGKIDSNMYKFLKNLLKLQKKEKEGVYILEYRYNLGETEKIRITKELFSLLNELFDGNIKNIRKTKLTEYLKAKKITKEQEVIFTKLKKAYVKGVIDDVVIYDKDIEESDEEPQVPEEPLVPGEPEVRDEQIIEDLDEGYSPDSPRLDEQGNPRPYDDVERGKYKDRIKEGKYIVPHRKAFVDFVNEDFYKEILSQSNDPYYNESKNRYGQSTPSSLNVYQILVREYLSIETPYRGLLVYHGLGTGKTATAVSMAEKTANDMRITTLLPASLETNFIGEVKQWGKNELDMHGSLWTFTSFEDYEKKGDIRKQLFDKYSITTNDIKLIMNHTIREVKKKIKTQLIEESPDLQDKKVVLFNKTKIAYKKIASKVLSNKGFWIHGSKGTKYDDMDTYQQIYLECQIYRLIQLKYNFIHYNPLPTINESDLRERDEQDELFQDEVELRGNALIKETLLQRLNYNIQNYGVHSPFYNEKVIIDEVHNLVREVVNNSGSARTFYEWIVNAEKVKLVFLSGTPIINKPSEIAILYNMLRGKQKVYSFTVRSSTDPKEVIDKLNDIFYSKKSPIELFHVSQREGKLVISFTMNQESFVSLMNPTNKKIYTSSENSYSYDEFIEAIYGGLTKEFEESMITPTKKDALSSKEKSVYFDKQMNVPFYRSQKLFEIKSMGELIDLSEDENFMEYFFMDNFEIEDRNRTLLKRMLMGLTSYYPIDRSKIGSMPSVVQPNESPEYSGYSIATKMNVESCVMSSLQFNKYIEAWREEKKKDLIRKMRRHLNEEIPFDFNIRTRQICNMIYKDDEFRYIRDKDRALGKKIEQYQELKQNKALEYDVALSEYSPKLHRMLTNIMKFRDGVKTTGKILIYSDFRGDAGGEIVEEVLKANGYSLYDPTQPSTDSLKYTFITGEESVDLRKLNMKAYNDKSNKYGEQIQIMIISGAGAEGISLTCVRQVHILEPYWNFVRIDQVFGRAIRLFSHDDLDPKDRNVEEYLYISSLPSGSSIEEIYKSIKGWDNIAELKNIKSELVEGQNKDIKDTIEMIQNIGLTVDQKIFSLMETKYKVSQNMIDIIKESSLDCIQHTRDEPDLNDRCIRFSNKLLSEIAYFPGISADELFEIDLTQLKASFMLFMKPNTYVIGTGNNSYVYYESAKEGLDIRYLRENAKKLCSLSLDDGTIYVFAEKDHDLNPELGKQFSVYQDMYSLDKYVDSIDEQKFPSFKTILGEQKIGYKIKFNLNEMMFFSPHEDNKLRRLYKFEEYIEKRLVKPLILCDKEVFIKD